MSTALRLAMRASRNLDTGRVARFFALLGAFMLVSGVAGDAQAAKYRVSGGCDCASSQAGGYCQASSVTYNPASGEPLTVSFADPDGSGPENNVYTCGQYANGDVWVVGKSDGAGGKVVRVASTTPDWQNTSGEGCASCSEGKNGWMVDPKSQGEQRLDGRVSSNFTPPESLPRSYSVTTGYRSFIKDIGRGTAKPNNGSYYLVCNTGDNHFQCSKFNATVTFVECTSGCARAADTDGDGFTHDEFRPSWFGSGTNKVAGVRVDQLELDTLGNLPASSVSSSARSSWTFKNIRDNYRWQRLDHMTGWSQWIMMGLNNFSVRPGGFSGASRQEYGVEMMSINSAAIMRLALDDWQLGAPGDDSYQAMVNVVQIGLDTYAIHRASGKQWRNSNQFKNAGGHHGGRKVIGAFAAHLLRNQSTYGPAMQTWIQGDNFFEDVEVNTGSNGVPYYGIVVGDCAGWLDGDGSPSASSGRGQCQSFTSGNSPNASNPAEMDSYCRYNSSYPARQSNMARYQRLAVTLHGMESLWGDDPYLDFAYGWAEGGRASGHTGGHLCTPTGSSHGWMNGHNTQTGASAVAEHTLGNAMWAALKNTIVTAGEGTPGVDPPAAPILLED